MENLNTIAVISLIVAAVCMLIIIIDILSGHRQHMMIMNFVYPVTALYAGPLALIIYFTIGRKSTASVMMDAREKDNPPPGKQKPFWQSVAVGALALWQWLHYWRYYG